MNELAALAQSVCHEGFPFVRSGERSIVEPLVDDAAVENLRSALGGRWEDEFGVWECILDGLPIWEFGSKKRSAKGLGGGAAAVEDAHGLFVGEGGQDDEGLWVVG